MGSSNTRAVLAAGALVAAIALFGALAIGCTSQPQEPPAQTAEPAAVETAQPQVESAPNTIVAVSEANFDAEVVQATMPVLVDFYADWCGPCRALHPTLEKLAAEYAGRVKIVQINVDANGQLADRYSVRSIPALFVIKSGKVSEQTVGLQPENQLRAMLDRALK